MTREQRTKTRFAIDCVTCALHAEECGLPDEDVRKAITQASYILDDVISQLGGKRAEIVPSPAAVSAADESMPDDSVDLLDRGAKKDATFPEAKKAQEAGDVTAEAGRHEETGCEPGITAGSDIGSGGNDGKDADKIKHFDGVTATKLSQDLCVDYTQIYEWCEQKGLPKFGRGYKLTKEQVAEFRKTYGV